MRIRRSPFIEVRFISPEVAAGRITWQASPIRVEAMSTSTANRPPWRIAAMMASTRAARSPAGTLFMASFTRSVRFL